jgi:DNA-binding NarL/FixJ family response regulator
MSRARLMIVEDEVIAAEDLSRGLRTCGYDVTGYAVNGCEAVDMARSVKPDLILINVDLKGDVSAIAAAERISGLIDVPIIFIAGHSTESLLDAAVRVGADGFIVRPFQMRQLTAAIEVALHRHNRGQRTTETKRQPEELQTWGRFAPQMRRVQTLLANETTSTIRDDSGRVVTELHITPREKEIITGLVCYRRLSTVADVLGISVHTARNHLKSVFRKLDLHSQEELLRYVIDGEGV